MCVEEHNQRERAKKGQWKDKSSVCTFTKFPLTIPLYITNYTS